MQMSEEFESEVVMCKQANVDLQKINKHLQSKIDKLESKLKTSDVSFDHTNAYVHS